MMNDLRFLNDCYVPRGHAGLNGDWDSSEDAALQLPLKFFGNSKRLRLRVLHSRTGVDEELGASDYRAINIDPRQIVNELSGGWNVVVSELNRELSESVFRRPCVAAGRLPGVYMVAYEGAAMPIRQHDHNSLVEFKLGLRSELKRQVGNGEFVPSDALVAFVRDAIEKNEDLVDHTDFDAAAGRAQIAEGIFGLLHTMSCSLRDMGRTARYALTKNGEIDVSVAKALLVRVPVHLYSIREFVGQLRKELLVAARLRQLKGRGWMVECDQSGALFLQVMPEPELAALTQRAPSRIDRAKVVKFGAKS